MAPSLLALLVAGSIGALNGLGIAYLGLHPLIMTLAMATTLQGVLVMVAGGSAVSVSNPILSWLGSARMLGIPAAVLLWIAIAAGALYWLHGVARRHHHLRARHQSAGEPPLRRRGQARDAC